MAQVLRSGVVPHTCNKPALGHRQIAKAKEASGTSGEEKKKSVPKSEDKVQKQEESKPAKVQASCSCSLGYTTSWLCIRACTARTGCARKQLNSSSMLTPGCAALQSDGFNRPRNKLFLASEQSLGYLDGTLPGDFGFDPLGLSDPEAKPDAGAGEGFISPSWLAYAEVYHCRWAMLGAAGCIFPEIFAKLNIIPQTPAEVTWFRAGVIPPAGSYTYWTGGPVHQSNCMHTGDAIYCSHVLYTLRLLLHVCCSSGRCLVAWPPHRLGAAQTHTPCSSWS